MLWSFLEKRDGDGLLRGIFLVNYEIDELDESDEIDELDEIDQMRFRRVPSL